MPSARQLLERLLGEAEADVDQEVPLIVRALADRNMPVESQAKDVYNLSFVDDPGGLATELMTGKPKRPVASPADSEEAVTYVVTPMEGWRAYVGRAERRGEDWGEFSEERRQEFAEVVERFGYDVASMGGHPPNVEYQKAYGALTVSFFFLGNPRHV